MTSFITYSGWLLSALGIGLSIVLYRRGRLVKRLELRQLVSACIEFPGNVEPYHIVFNGNKISDTITRIQFSLRNTGNTGIERGDLRGDATIDVEITNGEILGAYIGTGTSNEVPKDALKLRQDRSSIVLDWDYIDPSDNFPIVMYCSGKYKGAKLRGKFKSRLIAKTAIGPKRTKFRLILYPTILVFMPVIVFEYYYAMKESPIYSRISGALTEQGSLILCAVISFLFFYLTLTVLYFWVKIASRATSLLRRAIENPAETNKLST